MKPAAPVTIIIFATICLYVDSCKTTDTWCNFAVYLLSAGSFMIYVTRKEHFNAAHRLYNPAWTEEKNQAVFGPCANNNWHGHNFELVVTVKGKPDPD